MARVKKVLRGDALFKQLIDEFFQIDEKYKHYNNERERLRKKLINMIRYGHRGHGVHFGNLHALMSGREQQRRFSQDKARKLMGELLYKRAFRRIRYTQLSALSWDEAEKEAAKK